MYMEIWIYGVARSQVPTIKVIGRWSKNVELPYHNNVLREDLLVSSCER